MLHVSDDRLFCIHSILHIIQMRMLAALHHVSPVRETSKQHQCCTTPIIEGTTSQQNTWAHMYMHTSSIHHLFPLALQHVSLRI
jgi:hypothetical protein